MSSVQPCRPRGYSRSSRREAEALAADFNRVFAGGGVRLIAGARARFCFACSTRRSRRRPPTPEEVLPADDVLVALPRGADAPRLRRLASEIEMWLFEHAVNAARRARAAPVDQRPVALGRRGGSMHRCRASRAGPRATIRCSRLSRARAAIRSSRRARPGVRAPRRGRDCRVPGSSGLAESRGTLARAGARRSASGPAAAASSCPRGARTFRLSARGLAAILAPAAAVVGDPRLTAPEDRDD